MLNEQESVPNAGHYIQINNEIYAISNNLEPLIKRIPLKQQVESTPQDVFEIQDNY